jgi:hypothetical protein
MELVPDCLVLKIEENELITKEIDTTLFILYDKKEENYVIRGKRREFKSGAESSAYSFVCKDIFALTFFISFVLCKSNLWTFVLYNYDNLPCKSEEITYEFLKDYESPIYELSAYDMEKFSRKKLLNILDMLKNVSNEY